MGDKELRGRLVRLAHANPNIRNDILPLLVVPGMTKQAINKDTQEFATWALNQPPMSAGDVEGFVRSRLKIKTRPPQKRRPGPRYQPGDTVRVDKTKHKDRDTLEVYERYHGATGTVVGADGDDAIVDLDNGQRGVVFPLAQKRSGVGLMKYTRPYTIEGSPLIEMLYVAGGKPTPDQKVVVENYLGRARPGETRTGQYYSGSITMASTGRNGYYFKALPQQRTQVQPGMSYSEIGWRTFSPNVGEVHYIGVLNRRPSNWRRELEEMRAGALV